MNKKQPVCCKTCDIKTKDLSELRNVVYAILNALPSNLVAEYAQEKLELMTYDSAMEQAADGAEVMREGYCDR